MKKKSQIKVLILLVILLVIVNYPFLDSALEKFLLEENYVKVQRVIDGDTIVVDNQSVRLLGINTPERGEKYYLEAKEFLEKRILDKKVRLEGVKKDRYYRELRYVFLGEKNINLEVVREGFANVYILDDKTYEEELRKAWELCVREEKNLCKMSEDKCADCIGLKKFDYKSQKIVFYNKCYFDCDLNDWMIRDEGRKKFVFENFVLEKNSEVGIFVGEGKDNKEILFWKGENYVWTKTGDTLFLRDNEGELVLWRGY